MKWQCQCRRFLNEYKSLLYLASSIHNLELLNSYKDPIVDIKETTKKARESIWSIRSNKDFKKIAQEVYLKHGSRFKKKAYRKSTQ